MQKMNNILEVYAQEESFTESERNLLLDYNLRIREAIKNLQVEPLLVEEPEEEALSTTQEAVPEPAPSKTTDPKKAVKATAVVIDEKPYAELLNWKDSGDLSGKLESTPIKEIATAFGLNERIVCQNVLFNGDKQMFDLTVEKLNGMNSYQEATQYLCREIVDRYDWMNENKIKNAQIFLKLVRRRYS